MVTVDSASCAQLIEEYPICFAGDKDGSSGDGMAGEDERNDSTGAPTSKIASTDDSNTHSTYTAPPSDIIGTNAPTESSSGEPVENTFGSTIAPGASFTTGSSSGGSEAESSAVSSGACLNLVMVASSVFLLSVAPHI